MLSGRIDYKLPLIILKYAIGTYPIHHILKFYRELSGSLTFVSAI